MYGDFLNSTGATDSHLIIQTNTPYIGSTQRPVSSSAFYMSTTRVLKEGEINKPDLVTYIILFFFLLLAVTIIVLFINCQLKNSFSPHYLMTDHYEKRGARGRRKLSSKV